MILIKQAGGIACIDLAQCSRDTGIKISDLFSTFTVHVVHLVSVFILMLLIDLSALTQTDLFALVH